MNSCDNEYDYKFVGTNYIKEREKQQYLQKTGELDNISMYQICLFENPLTKKHKIRRIVIDHGGNYVCVKEYEFKKKYIEKLREDVTDNQILCYSTFDLKGIDYPSWAEYMTAKSSLFSNSGTLDDYYSASL